jgi:hypothetical protein
MTSNLKVRFPAPFPVTVTGSGGIAVSKADGIWIIEPDFAALAEILPAALADPSAKQIWVFDPVTESYNVLTLAGLGDALYKATSTTSLAIGAGSKTFVTQSGKDLAVGSFLLATSDADPANYLLGQITAYSGTSLTISVSAGGVGGSGTLADWTLRASAPSGAAGAAGATGPGYAATSATSNAIASYGSKTFATQAGLAYSAGARVRASDALAPSTNWMEGVVSSYSGTSLVFAADKSLGSGTFTSWTINVAGQPGADGGGAGDVVGPSSATDGRFVLFDGATGKLVKQHSGAPGALAVLNSVGATQIDANAVSNAKLAQMAAHTFKGNSTGAVADPVDVTFAQMQSALDLGLIFVEKLAANASVTLTSSAFSSDYDDFLFVFSNITPTTDSVGFNMIVESGGSFQSTTYLNANATTASIDISTSNSISNSSGKGLSGALWLNDVHSTSVNKWLTGRCVYALTSTNVPTVANSNGYWNGGQGALTRVRFQMTSGNMATGSVKIYGLKKS